MLARLLGLTAVGGTVVSVELLYRFLLAAANVLILAIISAFMLCALLASIFYMIYFCLVLYGVDARIAGAILSIVVLFVTIVLVAATFNQLQKLREMSQGGLHGSKSAQPVPGHVIRAFINGFLNRRK